MTTGTRVLPYLLKAEGVETELSHSQIARTLEYIDRRRQWIYRSWLNRTRTSATAEDVAECGKLLKLWFFNVLPSKLERRMEPLRTYPRVQVTDTGLSRLKGMPRLLALSLSGTEATHGGLEGLGNLSHLDALDLSGTRVTDAGLMRLAGLSKLQYLKPRAGPLMMATSTVACVSITDRKESNTWPVCPSPGEIGFGLPIWPDYGSSRPQLRP